MAAITAQNTRVTISLEAALYALVVLAALVLRIVELGAAPLSAMEAERAIAALEGVGGPPLTTALTALAFLVGGVAEGTARFFPMVAGSLLVLSPLLFRGGLGRIPTLIAVVVLAVLPTTVVTSRLVGGYAIAMLMMVGFLYGVERFLATQSIVSVAGGGVLLALALLADYATLLILIAMAAGVAFMLLTDEENVLPPEVVRGTLAEVNWGAFILAFTGALLVAGTALFLAPGGLGALADQLGQFASGVVRRVEGVAAGGVVLAVYEPGLLIIGLIGAWVASQSQQPALRFLAGWGAAAVLLAVVYPGSMPGHVLYAVVPLAALTGVAVQALLEVVFEGPSWGVWVFAGVTIALLTMILFSVSEHVNHPEIVSFPMDAPADEVVFSVSFQLVLALLWTILLAAVWASAATAFGAAFPMVGLWIGVLAMSAVMAVGHSISLAWTDPTSPYEVINPAPTQPTAVQMMETIKEVGEIGIEDPLDVSITVQGPQDDVLVWLLRDYGNVTIAERVDPSVTDFIVLTPAEGADPALGSAYVGQDVVVTRQWLPQGLDLRGVLRWVLYHASDTLPAETRYILWVREDVYRIETP